MLHSENIGIVHTGFINNKLNRRVNNITKLNSCGKQYGNRFLSTFKLLKSKATLKFICAILLHSKINAWKNFTFSLIVYLRLLLSLQRYGRQKNIAIRSKKE